MSLRTAEINAAIKDLTHPAIALFKSPVETAWQLLENNWDDHSCGSGSGIITKANQRGPWYLVCSYSPSKSFSHSRQQDNQNQFAYTE